MPHDPLSAAEAALGHRFARPALLREALTHRSVARPGGVGSNERLEFIGDRVLGLIMAEWLAERFPGEQEGALGRRLAYLVAQPVLARIAGEARLPASLDVAPGEVRAGVKLRATVLADAMEAAIGALFLDGGIDPARRFIRAAWAGVMEELALPPKDAKTTLQEWAQGRGLDLPDYVIAARHGPSHAPAFVITVALAGRQGRGSAGSKRAAEQAAALDLLGQLE